MAISDACEGLAKPVALPAVKEGTDLGVIAAANRSAAVKANARLKATAKCQAAQRKRFGAR